MCGIAGFWGDIAQGFEAPARLDRMTTALAHRGPDGQACWIDSNAGLGHTRLAIIDLTKGDQPMWDATRTWVIVFNGEIYNYVELRQELLAKGYRFNTNSDTEVIPAAVDAWGVNAGLLRLRGMFAFALYNISTRRLLMARDRVGIKPLYYAKLSQGGLFGSEPKALLASRLLERRLDPVALHDYLAQGYSTTPATCWAEIQMLEPGTWLEAGPNGLLRQGRYWTWCADENRALSLSESVDKTEQALIEALKYHLVSDVPLAAFLSGGLDSSITTALLARDVRPGIQTFCMSFGDPAFDESDAARQVAEHCGTAHHEIRMDTNADDPELFAQVVEGFDEPYGDSSCLPTYLVCREMRKHVKVALSGDGGDEVLGGYNRYLRAKWLAAAACLGAVGRLANPTMTMVGRTLGSRGRRLAKGWQFAQLPRAAMLLELHTYFTESDRQALYRPDFATYALADGPTLDRFAQLIPQDVTDPMQQLLAAEFRLRLHADYLRKVDVTSSANGFEVRVPYLDNAVLDLSAQLPNRYKISGRGETKIIARRLARRLLPPSIATRPKQGFSVPLDRWMGRRMNDFLHDTLLSADARIGRLLQPEAVHNVWRAFNDATNENATRGVSRFQRYQRLFMLTALELWLRKWDPSL